MTDVPKDTKVKAIRSGIAIATDNDKPQPNTKIVEELKQLLKEAEEGLIQELAYSAVGEINKYVVGGYSSQMGYQLRGMTLLYEDVIYTPMWDIVYGVEE